MSILIVTGIEGARNCAAVVGDATGHGSGSGGGRKAALAALRRREFSAVVVDETMAECDPCRGRGDLGACRTGDSAADQLCALRSGAADPRDSRRPASAGAGAGARRRAAAAAIENELKSTVAGLLLHSQLALSGNDASSRGRKLRVVADLAGNLRQQLSVPSPAHRDDSGPEQAERAVVK